MVEDWPVGVIAGGLAGVLGEQVLVVDAGRDSLSNCLQAGVFLWARFVGDLMWTFHVQLWGLVINEYRELPC